jgi:hypothetical protein
MRKPIVACFILLATTALRVGAAETQHNNLLICVEDLEPLLGGDDDAMIQSPDLDCTVTVPRRWAGLCTTANGNGEDAANPRPHPNGEARGETTECADVSDDNKYAAGRIAEEAVRRLQAAKPQVNAK